MSDIDFYLLIDRIKIENANAVSSPLTYGFPAISGFLGAVHALQRKIPFGVSLSFDGALIASHETRIKRYRPTPYSDYTFNQSRNPIKKNGNTASIIEEGKVDLTVSLVIPVCCDDDEDFDWLAANKADFVRWAEHTIKTQRMAGGSVFDAKAELIKSEDLDDLKAKLAPAFILMDAKQDLIDITQELQQKNSDATSLDALLEVATLHHVPCTRSKDNKKTAKQEDEKAFSDKENKVIEWKIASVKQGRGWLVPMPVGYQAISPLFEAGTMKDCRSTQYPSQFVEALYGLGKWVFPYNLSTLEGAFWQMKACENDLYLVEQISE